MGTLGIALSGGGVRGAAHVGVLKALLENGIKPDYISGTSSGSIVASLYACGYSIKEMEDLFMSYQNSSPKNVQKNRPNSRAKSLADFDLWGTMGMTLQFVTKSRMTFNGFVKGDILEREISKMLEVKGVYNINQIKMPLAIPTVDINTSQTVVFVNKKDRLKDTGDTIYIDDANLAEAIRASIAFPMVFKPKFINGRRLVDGGVKHNIPVDILKLWNADRIMASTLGYRGEERNRVRNFWEIGMQSIDILQYELAKFRLADERICIIHPHIDDVSLLETRKIAECIQRGYDTVMGNYRVVDSYLSSQSAANIQIFGKSKTNRGG